MLGEYKELARAEELAPNDFEFEQKLGEVSIDSTKYSKISQDVDHFRKLVFENFDSDSQKQIQMALLQMFELHKDQKNRPDGMPYISHPLEVSRAVIQDFGIKDKDLVNVALLHDAVEDQALKLARIVLEAKYGSDSLNDSNFIEQQKCEIREIAFTEIGKIYGDKVVSILKKLTNPDFNVIAGQEVDPQDRVAFKAKKNELYKKHVEEAIVDADALVIKLADFIHNTSDASQLPESLQRNEYRMKYVPVISVFIERLQQEGLTCPITDKKSVIEKLNFIAREFSEQKIDNLV